MATTPPAAAPSSAKEPTPPTVEKLKVLMKSNDSEMEALLDDPEPSQLGDAVFTPAQMSAIQETLASLVHKAMRVLQDREA